MDRQVVVVGAGPVGLMLAGELRLGGADVLVLERLAAPTTQSRASSLHARTMELFDQRGLLDELGTPPREPMSHFGGIPLDISHVPSRHAGLWKVAQARVEELLAAWATGLGAVIRRRYEVVGLAAEDATVRVTAAGPTGRSTVTAGFVAGCDGERSTVRRLAGVAFPGADASRELLRADVAGIEVPNRRFERLPGGLAIASRRPDGVTRVMMAPHVRPRPRPGRRGDAAPSFAEICATWDRLTGEDLRGGEPLWCDAFGNASRQAERYVAGRVLLAGDAAHQQMPVGGQAINLGLQDAVNAGWKLAAVVTGRAPEALLDTYDAERRPVGARTRAFIDAQAALLLGGPEVDGLRGVLAELIRYPEVRDRLAATLAGIDVRYSGLNDSGRPDSGPGGHALAGLRVPHVELRVAGRPTSTTALLHAARSVLLDLTGDPARRALLTPAAAGADVDLVFADPAPGTPLAGVGAVLLRPDGHVGYAAGPDADPWPAPGPAWPAPGLTAPGLTWPAPGLAWRARPVPK